MRTREQREALDKDALIQIILGQSARIAQLEAGFSWRPDSRGGRILALEARLNQNSKNSPKPPSQDSTFEPRANRPKTRRKSAAQRARALHSRDTKARA